MIREFAQSFSSPAENLACDEALLEACETSADSGFLRFWEAPGYFVVLGFSKALAREVFEENCTALKIPICRRISGGGTVLQGPGSLNYTLVLPFSFAPELETITGANRLIMERNRQAFARLTSKDVQIRGHTDLAVGELKFSGNAQRRKRQSLLFHGSVLLDLDLPLISRTLRPPFEQPQYRNGRSHADFLINLNISAGSVMNAFSREWGCTDSASPQCVEQTIRRTDELAKEKYGTRAWTRRA